MKSINTKLSILLLLIGWATFSKAQINFTMNEVFSRGTTTDPDWIEIYNLSNAALDISGYKIYDSGGQAGTKPKKEFATGTTIPANGFLVVVTDDTSATGFGLSSNGETVWIENTGGTVIDSVVFPTLQTNESYSRVPNGQSWVITNSITKGTSNIYSNPTTIVMNEIYSRGTAENPDWIELYNPSSTQIDISGFKIYDNGGYTGSRPKMEIAVGSIINGNDYFVIVTDDTTLTSGFGLSGNGEEVWLEDATGLVIDDVNFPVIDSANSYSRFPDGTSSWQLTTTISKGFANTITEIEEEITKVNNFGLSQNYPNPFNPTTTINYKVPIVETHRDASQHTSLKVYDVLGNEVATLVEELKNSGSYEVTFDASKFSSGVYFYKLKAGEFIETRKMLLLK